LRHARPRDLERRRLLTRIESEIDDEGIFCRTRLGYHHFDRWLAEAICRERSPGVIGADLSGC
jgi:hypothetical protein